MFPRQLHTILFRRVVLMVPILVGIVTVTFFVTRVAPGDPAYLIAGPLAPPSVIKGIQHQLGTDKPLTEQYWDYLKGAAGLDLGTSIVTRRPVIQDLRTRLPATLELILLALFIALAIGIPAGALAARRRGKTTDTSIRFGSFIFLSLPDFWFGLMLLYIFFFKLGWAPGFGQIGPSDPQVKSVTGAVLVDASLRANGPAVLAAFKHAILPVLTLGLIFSAPIARLTRSAMLEVLDADYVRFARSCGVRGFTLWRYSVRASLPPVLTFAGSLFAALIGGAVLVETVFSWGGVAQYAAQAINQKDYPAVQGFVLMSGVISVVVFLIVDILYVLIDPRVRL